VKECRGFIVSMWNEFKTLRDSCIAVEASYGVQFNDVHATVTVLRTAESQAAKELSKARENLSKLESRYQTLRDEHSLLRERVLDCEARNKLLLDSFSSEEVRRQAAEKELLRIERDSMNATIEAQNSIKILKDQYEQVANLVHIISYHIIPHNPHLDLIMAPFAIPICRGSSNRCLNIRASWPHCVAKSGAGNLTYRNRTRSDWNWIAALQSCGKRSCVRNQVYGRLKRLYPDTRKMCYG
jgi:hypothetical protein